MHFLIILLLLCDLLFADNVKEADSLLQCSAKYFEGSSQFNFNFQVQTRIQTTGEELLKSGELKIGKDNKFALKMQDQEITSDGTNLWQYNILQKQVLIKLISDLENKLHPTELLFRYLNTKAKTSAKEVWKGKSVNALTLDPSKYKGQFSAMEVWLSPKDCSPVRLHTVDNLGNDAWYSIENLSKQKFSAKDFKFSLPFGADEIDMR